MTIHDRAGPGTIPRRAAGWHFAPGVGPSLSQSAAAAWAVAGAAAFVDRHRLCRVVDCAPDPELLLGRRVLRHGEARVHTCDLCGAAAASQYRHHRPKRADGRCRDRRRRVDRVSDRLLCGTLCDGRGEGPLLRGGDDAAVVELSRQDLCLEADPRQGRHHHLARRPNGAWASSRLRAGDAGDRRPVVVDQLSRHVRGVRLCLAALYGPPRSGGSSGCRAA